jgi:sugar O-acyltransferase (sialic acid O-acetyltransferase NeuD family)
VIRIVIVGAGGFGRDVAQFVRDVISDGADIVLKGFLDDDPASVSDTTLGAPVVGTTTGYQIDLEDRFVIALGDPQFRRVLTERMAARGAQFFTLVHPRAYVIPSASIGEGCIIAPFATVGARARLAHQVAVTYGASVGHDASIGPFCVLSPSAATQGFTTLEDEVFLGTHAIVNPGKRVGRGAKVASASVVYRDVPAGHLALGNPAKSRVMLHGSAAGETRSRPIVE